MDNEFFKYLQTPTNNGQTIYGHLAQILAQILDDQPANPIEALSSISLQIKGSASSNTKEEKKDDGILTDKEFTVIEEILNQFERRRPKVQQRYADINEVNGQTPSPADGKNKEAEKPTQLTELEEKKARLLASKTAIANFTSLNTCLQMFNEGLETSECVLLRKRMEQFVYDRRGFFSSVRFFGRFSHSEGFYYVLECLPSCIRKSMYDPLKAIVNKEEKCQEIILELRQMISAFAERYLNKTADDVMKSLIEKKKKKEQEKKENENTEDKTEEQDQQFDINDYVYLKKRQVIELSDEIKKKLDPSNLGFDLTTIPPKPEEIFIQPLTPPDLVHPQGMNRFVYFVANGLYDVNNSSSINWIRLPDITTEQMKLSRFINCRLSGDLSKIFWRRIPVFPGLEMHYLRCVIARIKHGTEIAPANTMVQNTTEPYNLEDDPEENAEIGNEAFEIDEDQVLKADPDFKERRRYARWFTYDKEKQEIIPTKAFLATDFLPWPIPNSEPLTDTGALDFGTVKEIENWVHTVPILSHRGKVLPYNFDGEKLTASLEEKLEQDIEEEDDDSMAGNEDLEEEIEPDEEGAPLSEEKQKKKEKIEKIKKQLEEMKGPETDQTRILKEKRLHYKRTTIKKNKWISPKPFWETVRDPWDPVVTENPNIYKEDRWFGMEIPCCDIHAAEIPVPDKVQTKIDAEQEVEDAAIAEDERCKNGDEYNETERPEGDKPELLAPISEDKPILVNPSFPDVDQPDDINVINAWVINTNPRLANKSPVIVKSNKWVGAMACAWGTGYGCVYIGDGRQAEVGKAFDLERFVLPPPMMLPPANIMEENDPELEVENEVNERIADQERRKRDRDEKRRIAEQEAEEELRRQREEEERAAREAEEEQNAQNEEEDLDEEDN